MSKVVLILFVAWLGCSAQPPHVLTPVNYNNGPNPWQAQQWNGQQNPWQDQQWNGQQNPWQNQPRNFYPQYNPYSYQGVQQPWQNQPRNFYPQYNPYQGSQQQWPQQQPWNNNNFNRWPQNPMQNPMQNPNSCNNELQSCFNQMPEYWDAVQSIENNPVLTKEEVNDHKKTLVRRLPDDVQNCYKNAENNAKKCVKQRQNTNGLSNDARKAFSKIKNIQNNKRLTKQDECHQIGQVLQSLNPSVTNELFNRMPELRQHMNQMNQNPYQMNQHPYNNMYPNQMNQNPYQMNQYPNQMNQYPNYQFTQFNRNERKQ